MTTDSITLPQAAALLRASWFTARRLARSGALGPAKHFAGRWVLDRAAVEAYASQRRAKSATVPLGPSGTVLETAHVPLELDGTVRRTVGVSQQSNGSADAANPSGQDDAQPST